MDVREVGRVQADMGAQGGAGHPAGVIDARSARSGKRGNASVLRLGAAGGWPRGFQDAPRALCGDYQLWLAVLVTPGGTGPYELGRWGIPHPTRRWRGASWLIARKWGEPCGQRRIREDDWRLPDVLRAEMERRLPPRASAREFGFNLHPLTHGEEARTRRQARARRRVAEPSQSWQGRVCPSRFERPSSILPTSLSPPRLQQHPLASRPTG